VGVGQATRQRAFVTANRDELVRLFQSSFREDKYDEALRTGVAFVERTLRSNLSGQVPSAAVTRPAVQGTPLRQMSPVPSSSHSSGGSLLILGVFIVGGILVVIFLMRLFAAEWAGRRGVSPGTPGWGGGGGFFEPALAAAARAGRGWLYDRFFSGTPTRARFSL
jgi:hypothetical protein